MKKVIWFYIGIQAVLGFGVAVVQGGEIKTEAAEMMWQSAGDFHYRLEHYKEKQNGYPGYDARFDFIKTRSPLYPQADEIGRYINGQLLEYLFRLRQETVAVQNDNFCPGIFREQQNLCENRLSLEAKGGMAVGTIVSLRYHYFSAPVGAAHPLTVVKTYNFSLSPLFQIESLAEIFTDSDTALPLLKEKIKKRLLAMRDKDGGQLLDKNMVEEGLKNWQSLGNFLFNQNGIRFIFSPYAVAPYVFGTLEITLSYTDLPPLKSFYGKALRLR